MATGDPRDIPQSTCPNCGYCPHCGRSNYPVYPRPYIQPTPYQPWIDSTGTAKWPLDSGIKITF